MVERKVCTFCGNEIEPGTGRMYIKKDGAIYNFCTSKCFKNLVQLRRVPRRTTWTVYYAREKQVRMKGAPEQPQPAKARKLKKGEVETAKVPDAEPKAEAPEAKVEAKPKDAKKAPAEKAEKKPAAKRSEQPKKEPAKAKPAEDAKA